MQFIYMYRLYRLFILKQEDINPLVWTSRSASKQQ